MLTEISGGTITFHINPKGKHKTMAIWIDRKLEKAKPIQLSSQVYHTLIGAMMDAGHNVLRERRSDNSLVAVIGEHVFSNSEYERKRAERIAAEGGA